MSDHEMDPNMMGEDADGEDMDDAPLGMEEEDHNDHEAHGEEGDDDED